MKNEKTSKRIAAIAAKALRRIESCTPKGDVWGDWIKPNGSAYWRLCTIAELKALCASVLTQAPDRKPKRK